VRRSVPAGQRFDPFVHHRRSIRLKHYDYRQAGVYFLTVCVQDRSCLFGEIVEGAMRLSAAGAMVQAVWEAVPEHYAGVELDAFVVMPNHVHGIVVLTADASSKRRPQDPTACSPMPLGNHRGLPLPNTLTETQ
jgi:putative transposase